MNNLSNNLYMVDSHEDIAWNVSVGRDFLEPAASWRKRVNDGEKYGERLVTLPDLLESPIRLIIGTIFVLPNRAASLWESPNYHNNAEAHEQGQAQLDFYVNLAKTHPDKVTLIRTKPELQAHIAEVEAGVAKLGLIISMEGADPITAPQELESWVAQGLRLIGPAWKSTIYCGGTGEPGPLTPLGYQLLQEMERLGVILDVSHMAEETFYNSLDAYKGTVIASHSNCRHYVNTDRQLSDDMIRRLVERDAVIGLVLYDRFLVGAANGKSNLEDAVRHISHICEIAGDTDAVAIGTDWDGGFGAELIPAPMQDVRDLPMLAETLLKHGFDENAVRKIFHGNWLNILQRSLPD